MRLNKSVLGKRIVIRNYEATDLDFIAEMWFDPENGRYMSDPTHEYIDDRYRSILNTLQDSTDGYYLVAELRESGERIGTAGIFPTAENDYDIGYCVHKDRQRQGYGTEIVSLLLDQLVSLGAETVRAEVAVGNLPSNLLMQKFGFAVEKCSEFKKYNMDICFSSYIYAKRLINFKAINRTNWRCGLEVDESQKAFVANSAVMLARAYAYRELGSRAYIICDGATPVGMCLYYDCPELGAYDLSQFFIDKRYQGRGYGRRATEMLLNMMRHDGRYGKVVLCYIEGNETAKSLYLSLGFVETDRDGDEIGMELVL